MMMADRGKGRNEYDESGTARQYGPVELAFIVTTECARANSTVKPCLFGHKFNLMRPLLSPHWIVNKSGRRNPGKASSGQSNRVHA